LGIERILNGWMGTGRDIRGKVGEEIIKVVFLKYKKRHLWVGSIAK
jgi:hypothetical protein